MPDLLVTLTMRVKEHLNKSGTADMIQKLREDGRNDILAYGIAFCKKRCKVVFEKL